MSQLLRRGLIAALAPAGVPNCDIIVTDDVGERLCAVQVKTRNSTGADGGWHMSRTRRFARQTRRTCLAGTISAASRRVVTSFTARLSAMRQARTFSF